MTRPRILNDLALPQAHALGLRPQNYLGVVRQPRGRPFKLNGTDRFVLQSPLRTAEGVREVAVEAVPDWAARIWRGVVTGNDRDKADISSPRYLNRFSPPVNPTSAVSGVALNVLGGKNRLLALEAVPRWIGHIGLPAHEAPMGTDGQSSVSPYVVDQIGEKVIR